MISRLTATLIWFLMFILTGMLAGASFERDESAPPAVIIGPLAGRGAQASDRAAESCNRARSAVARVLYDRDVRQRLLWEG